MADRAKVFDAIRNCITEPKCKDCPWEECEKVGHKRATVPVTLLLDALVLLKKQNPKPVEVQGNAYDYKFYHCPTCGRLFDTLYHRRPAFCDICGQAVIWND